MDEIVPFSAQEFVFETPLYESLRIDPKTASAFVALFNASKARVDGYCKQCGRESVFHSRNSFTSSASTLKTLVGFRFIHLSCQRAEAHLISIVTATHMEFDSNDELVLLRTEKIGQTPSHADIANGDLRRFSSILKGQDRAEFIRANGLAAHGVSIGAFVYLRRVFERLLWRARERAGDRIDSEVYARSRVLEKIDLLADFLPTFMVQNSKVYGVLSKGLHELDEAACAEYYHLLKRSCLLMLEQEKEQTEREGLERELIDSIARIKLS